MTNAKQLLILATLLATFPIALHAQPVASERATVSQTIDGTTISLDYARPRIRGRGEGFGDIAQIGDHRWTPGANWATMITSNKAFTMNGHAVEEGTWSLWIDLEEDAWTMILEPEDSLFHTFPPDDNDEQIRFVLEPREGPFIESLLFWVPETRIDGFDLLLSWGTIEIPFEIAVESTVVVDVAEAQGRPLEGEYEWQWTLRPGGPEGEEEPADPPPPLPFDVTWTDNRLDVMTLWAGTDDPFFGMLIPMGGDWYQLGWGEGGELWELIEFFTLEIVRGEDGSVDGFDVREPDDRLAARIRRQGTGAKGAATDALSGLPTPWHHTVGLGHSGLAKESLGTRRGT